MIIRSKNFILRPIKMSDLQGYFDCQQDEEAKKMFMSTPKNLKEAKKDLQKDLKEMHAKKPTREGFVIEVNGKFAGYIWFDEISYGFAKHKASFGYVVRKDFRGQGLGSKALKLMTDYAFKKYKLKRMYTYTRTFNKASARILEKAGFKLEGILRKNKFKNNKYLDDMLWAKVK